MPSPHDAADALAVAICHVHSATGIVGRAIRAGDARRPRCRAAGATTSGAVTAPAPMIALLRGTLLEKHPSRLIVDVGGVGYDVQVPLSTFYEVGEPGDGGRRCASTRTCARTRIALYGFATPLEQDCSSG